MKKEIIKKAIKAIRETIVIANQCQAEKDFNMYGHILTVADSKIDFLYELDLISLDKLLLLREICYKML